MQNVTTGWTNNQNQPLTSEGFVEVTYTINDPNAEATATGTPKHELSTMPEGLNPQLIDETEHTVTPLATLEQDIWLLDGSKTTVSSIHGDYGYTGFISNYLCDENGNFEKNPIIQINFKERVSILPGLIITWSTVFDDYPTEFKVTSYSRGDGEYVANETKTVTDNEETVRIVILEMTDIDRIEVEVIKWSSPNRRARIERIFPGLHKAYTKKDLLGFKASQSIDPLSATLPKYDVSFEVDNRDGDFDPLNPEGLSKYMMERQEIRTRYGFKLKDEETQDAIEWIPGGVYYLSEWSAPQNGLSATFKARDLLGFLNRTYHKGRFPTEAESRSGGVSLLTLAREVLMDANLPQRKTDTDGKVYPPWELDVDALSRFKTTAPLPICSFGECLQLIANATCCVIYFDREGILHIKRLKDDEHAVLVEKECEHETSDDCDCDYASKELHIYDGNSYTRPEIELTKPVKQIDVSMHSFINEIDRTDIYEGILPLRPNTQGNLNRNEFIVEFSDIAENVQGEIVEVTANDGSTRAVSGVTINTEIYARSCKLVLNSTLNEEVNCKVRFTGNIRRSSETIITTPNLSSGETQPLDNALITNARHAQEVGQWLKDNLSRRKHISLSWRADPRIDAGDIISTGGKDKETCIDAYDEQPGQNVRITSSNFSFSGAFKGAVEGVVE